MNYFAFEPSQTDLLKAEIDKVSDQYIDVVDTLFGASFDTHEQTMSKVDRLNNFLDALPIDWEEAVE